MRYTVSIITTILITAALLVVYIQSSTFLKNQAIDGCLQTARIQEQKENALITTPENYWYSFCLKEKGYK